MAFLYQSLLVSLLLAYIAILPTIKGTPNNGNIRERVMRLRSLRADLKESKGRIEFPDEIDGDIEVDGLPDKHFRAKRLKHVRLPVIEKDGITKKQKKKMVAKGTAFYTGDEGSFACVSKSKSGGKKKCELVGVVYEEDENCFLKNGKAFCAPRENGTDIIINLLDDFHPVNETNNDERKRRETSYHDRYKRQTVDSTARIINLAVFYDQSYMDRLKLINDGDYTAATQDAEMLAVLLGNEITYRLQSIKNYGNTYFGQLLDLACNVVLVKIPEENWDWPFLTTFEGGFYGYLDYGPSLLEFGTYAFNEGITSNDGVAHHAMLATGRNLAVNSAATSGAVGITVMNSVCNPDVNFQNYRISLFEDIAYNLGNIAAHELGHALGSSHDSEGNACATKEYVMSSKAFFPKEATQDTSFQFSSCTAQYIENHFQDSYGLGVYDCLDYQDSSFTENFCKGPRGMYFEASIERQCEARFFAGWTECNGMTKVPVDGCWNSGVVFCQENAGATCHELQFVMDGTPCEGADPQKDYYCHLGDCQEYEGICSDTTTPTTVAPPPPVATQDPSCNCNCTCPP